MVDADEEEKGELNQEKMPPELFEFAGGGGVWSISVEEQLGVEVGRGGLVLLVLVGAKGVDFGPLFLSHACRVAWSTGQASTGAAAEVEGSLDIIVVL